jgi:hypothetical protein
MVTPVIVAVDDPEALRARMISGANPGLQTVRRTAFAHRAEVAFNAGRVSPRFVVPRLIEAPDVEEG